MTSDCRRVIGNGRSALCGHSEERHGWQQGEAGEWRPCTLCGCPDYLPPDGMPYVPPAESLPAEGQPAEPLPYSQQLLFVLRRIEPDLHTPEGAERLIAWLGKHAPSYPSTEPNR